MTVGLYTLGCKVSQYETEAIAEEFEKNGYTVLPFSEPCDVYVINTCTVTRESDRKSRQIIRRAIKTNPDAIVCVTGCYSQTLPDEVSAIEGVDIIIGSDNKLSLVGLVNKRLGEGKGSRYINVSDIQSAPFEKMRITRAPRTRAYVKIEDGCEARCTYCAIPGARGRVRSKAPGDVIDEVEALAKSGVREIVLTGIETGSYGKDFDVEYDLADLLIELDRRKSCERIRLGSLAPELVGQKFAQKIKGLKILVPHFHISMQSGSDRVLNRMRRRYNREMAYKNLMALKETLPGTEFTTDLMVGFPGEDESDFLDTLDFVSKAAFLDCHVFAYSRRKGTEADGYTDQVSEDVKKERSDRLIKHKNKVRDTVLEKIVNEAKPLSVILENRQGDYLSAHSESFVEVRVKGGKELIGEAKNVKPIYHKDGIVYGEII